jgi:hypothetical protein
LRSPPLFLVLCLVCAQAERLPAQAQQLESNATCTKETFPRQAPRYDVLLNHPSDRRCEGRVHVSYDRFVQLANASELSPAAESLADLTSLWCAY